MEFKSQICTDINQSHKLLELGLKKETADMYYQKLNDRWELRIGQPITYGSLLGKYFYPAWSLHRLLEMLYADIGECMIFFPNTYEEIIADIENLIRRGTFNEDYLEEK